ncbi:MAG: HD domain-containing protein [Clostridia bacterium]|nr:HD domain-containing protein [Clostridia bacterium]
MEFIRAAANSDSVEGYCLIKTLDKKTTAKGLAYLDMILTDRSGEIVAKFWDYKEELHSFFEANMLVKVRGKMLEYNGEPQFRVERIRLVRDDDNVRIEDFVPSASYDGKDMLAKIYAIINSFSDEEVKKIVSKIVRDNEEKLVFWPAAFKLHHAIRGGLLVHTLSVVKLCKEACNLYAFLDRDLLLGGAILHDVAKTNEYDVASTGLAKGYTAKGELIGHLVSGAIMIDEASRQLGISGEVPILLEHMVISHHGDPEFGAAVRPLFPEAEVLSQIDKLDACMYEFADMLSNVKPNDFSSRHWALNNRKLYNHARKPIAPEANLD